VILALILRTSHLKSEQHHFAVPEYKLILPRYIKNGAFVSLALLLLIAGSFILMRGYAAGLYKESRKENNLLLTTETAARYRQIFNTISTAIWLNPLNADYVTKKADIILGYAQRKDHDTGISSWLGDRSQAWTKAEDLYKKAVDLCPTQARYHVNLAEFYATKGLLHISRLELENALLLDPQNKKIKDMIRNLVRALDMKTF